MSAVTEKSPSFNDVKLVKLAREIAMDIQPLEIILKNHEINGAEWDEIQANTHFRTLMNTALQEWNSATNTAERVRLKSMAFVEEALPEFFARAHDPKEPLQHKVRTLEVVAKFAGVGGNVDTGVSGERMVVTINLGADQQLKIERDITPTEPVTLEGNFIEEDRL